MQNDIIKPPQAEQKTDPSPSLPEVPAAAKPKVRSSKPMGIIVGAVVVCMILVVGTVYSGIVQSTDEKDTAGKPTASSQQASTTESGGSELDAIIAETADLSDAGADLMSEMSEQSIGL